MRLETARWRGEIKRCEKKRGGEAVKRPSVTNGTERGGEYEEERRERRGRSGKRSWLKFKKKV